MAVWNEVEERFRKRLLLWKKEHLSKGGRLTLLGFTFASLPIYVMLLFTIPRIVRLRLEKIQRVFLWGVEALENKLLLGKWSIVCKAKSKGGLGVRSLSLLNKPFFASCVGFTLVKVVRYGKILLGES